MRKLLIPGLTFALALAAAAGVTQATFGETGRDRAAVPTAGPLDPARAADREMLAYGEAHPDCAMWSNWEKLCSRIGSGGSTHCSVDPDRRVAPSRPFCARDFSATPTIRLESERTAAERFCLRHRGRLCARHDPERPFNGRRVAALSGPGCDLLTDSETGRPICIRGGDPAAHLPDCTTLAARHYEHPGLLACGAWSGPASCRLAPYSPPRDTSAGFIPQDPNNIAIHGLFCENR